ncbi:hypothetical protein [Saccharothrix sp. ST-888]|uniref:hypothetical protein n=1 Tax=Saccharothrix sp. ST-888 TaxID=1427391 RepID=UPI0005EBFC13|nr:hypothetical protein [Saccharothrix sp. ST-888]KJK56216.1 hypothetical protein UK12_23815 [Saccharothrix sp. ST-888]
MTETDSDDRAELPFDPILPSVRRWAMLKRETERIGAERDKLRDTIARAVIERGYRDHKGSQYLDLPMEIEGLTRIKRERRVTVTADSSVAEEITRSKGEEIYRRAFPPVPTLDTEELYVLLQEGVLTESDMDTIFVQRESFAFKGVS